MGRPSKSTGRSATPAPRGIRYRDERRVLRSCRDMNEDEVPQFVLEQATVYAKDGVTMANPLEVGLKGPFIIRGKLVIDTEEAAERLLNHSNKFAYIQVENCWTYSIGDFPATLWMRGRAGWMDVRPAPQFRPIYDKVLEGINLYYRIMDAYSAIGAKVAKKKRPRLYKTAGLDDVFLKYAVGAGDGVTRREVEQRCDDHAMFLINHFGKEDPEEIDWESTSFYDWMHHRHPDLEQKLSVAADEHAKRLLALSPSPADVEGGAGSSPDKEAARPVAPGPRPRPARVQPEPDPEATEEEEVEEEHELPIRSGPVMQHAAKPSRASRIVVISNDDDDVMDDAPSYTVPPSTRAISSAPILPPSSSFVSSGPILPPSSSAVNSGPIPPSSSRAAAGVVPFGAAGLPTKTPLETLVKIINEIADNAHGGRPKCSEKKMRSQIYTGYKIKDYDNPISILRFYAKDLLGALDPRWHTSPLWEWLKREARHPPRLEELPITRVEEITRPLERRQKATGVAVGAGVPGKRPKAPQQLPVVSSAIASSSPGSRTPQGRRYAGKAAGLRPTGAAKKRTYDEMGYGADDDDDDDYNFDPGYAADPGVGASGSRYAAARTLAQSGGGKRARSASVDDEEAEEEMEDAETDDDGKGPGAAPGAKVVLRSYPLPSDEPKGPRGTWLCEVEGCGYVVRSAKEPEQRELVLEHMRQHNNAGADSLLEQARDEGERQGKSIQHLLDRIAAANRKKPKAAKIGDRPVPEPIKKVPLGW